MAIYIIGGSPCSGKSTIAQAIARKYGFHNFKVDDHLDRYMITGAEDRKKCCRSIGRMTPDQIWLREPHIQCEEELTIYEEIFEYILSDLEKAASSQDVITEGAAYLPVLAKRIHVPQDRYISITPTKEFQIFHYSRREWVPHVLAGCSDKAKAFENWMERDALFARAAEQQCRECGYVSLINDGTESVETLINSVAVHFGFV